MEKYYYPNEIIYEVYSFVEISLFIITNVH